MARTSASKQIGNRNFLSPIGFKFTLSKFPKVDFFSNKASIPGINLGVAIQPTYLKDIPIPGDKLEYSDLTLDFLVDENLENYVEIHRWLIGLGYPENIKQFNDFRKTDELNPTTSGRELTNIYSDGTLQILNSNYQPQANIRFSDLFPTALSTLDFDATKKTYDYLTAQVTFKYTIYNILDINYQPL